MSRKHAILSPSASSKWLACPPSARLEASFPETTSEAAEEGTLAHSLAELLIAHRTKKLTAKKFREQLAILESDPLYNKAMYEYCDGFSIYVLEVLAEARARDSQAVLYVEEEIDLSAHLPEGFGHIDINILGGGVLDVIDFKYGKGVKVDARDNNQLRIYALGSIEEYGFAYDIHTIRLHIYQPRMNNVSIWEVSRTDLGVWAETVLKPAAQLAYIGGGEFAAGKQCQFCKAKITCKANAEYQLEIARIEFSEITDFDEVGDVGTDPKTLSDDQVTAILRRADAFKNWVKSVEDYALSEAKNGKTWPGFKLVNGKSKRTITDTAAVEKLLIKEGFDRTKIYKPQEMVAMTDIEKLTGKKFFDEKIATYTLKQPGAPTLVDREDPRPEIGGTVAAVADFDGLEEDE